ncbi:MAG: hypothetical protein K2Q06_07005, partial [Parvularculaceae bacterium]|nr:hypothetical protein [Parvularculaceae bacterium]
RLFPVAFDNAYRGSHVSLVLLGAVSLMKLGIGGGALYDTRMVLEDRDGLSLAAYGPAAADMLLAAFAVLGLSQVLLAGLSLLALIRYRAMAPLMLLVLTVEQIGRKAIFLSHPYDRPGGPRWQGVALSDWINYGMATALVIALILSLTKRR